MEVMRLTGSPKRTLGVLIGNDYRTIHFVYDENDDDVDDDDNVYSDNNDNDDDDDDDAHLSRPGWLWYASGFGESANILRQGVRYLIVISIFIFLMMMMGKVEYGAIDHS